MHQPFPIDLTVPEAIPFYSTLVNPHFPLTIAIIAPLAATFLRACSVLGFSDAPRRQQRRRAGTAGDRAV
ncbi:MAG: hypothetical protein U0528_07720 [Anaerolineae bacterium]